MSKKSIITREKILARALESFNERGVEYVGLRELAALLDMRVSNITYYFPTKDDLVNQLSIDLNQLNSEVWVIDEQLTMHGFLNMFKQAALNQVKYRGLLLSMVHLLTHNKTILARQKRTQADRNIILTENINRLIKAGYLKHSTDTRKIYLVDTIGLMARFWISESAISFRQFDDEEKINHYLSMIANLLIPYATVKSKQQLAQFLGEVN